MLPASVSACASGMEAASRMSSVSALKVRPSSAMVLPRNGPLQTAATLRAMERLRASLEARTRLYDPHWSLMVLPHLGECTGILWEAGSAKTRTWLQVTRADARIEADSSDNVANAGIDLLAELSHLVDVGDLGGQKPVCSIFDEFGRSPVGQQHAFPPDADAAIELRQASGCEIALRAYHDAVAPQEILHRSAGPQEFGV